MATLTLTLPDNTTVCHGKQVTFKAPCDCSSITSIIIEGTTYELVDLLNSTDGVKFAKDAMVSVILDTQNRKAYIQASGGTTSNIEISGDSKGYLLKIEDSKDPYYRALVQYAIDGSSEYIDADADTLCIPNVHTVKFKLKSDTAIPTVATSTTQVSKWYGDYTLNDTVSNNQEYVLSGITTVKVTGGSCSANIDSSCSGVVSYSINGGSSVTASDVDTTIDGVVNISFTIASGAKIVMNGVEVVSGTVYELTEDVVVSKKSYTLTVTTDDSVIDSNGYLEIYINGEPLSGDGYDYTGVYENVDTVAVTPRIIDDTDISSYTCTYTFNGTTYTNAQTFTLTEDSTINFVSYDQTSND